MTEKSRKVNESQIDFLKSCPFCDGTDLDRYRFTRAGFLDKPAWFEEKSATGDWFRIECDRCGCSFDKHEDELFDCIFNSCDHEITEDDLWNVMLGKWNERVPASPSEKEELRKRIDDLQKLYDGKWREW